MGPPQSLVPDPPEMVAPGSCHDPGSSSAFPRGGGGLETYASGASVIEMTVGARMDAAVDDDALAGDGGGGDVGHDTRLEIIGRNGDTLLGALDEIAFDGLQSGVGRKGTLSEGQGLDEFCFIAGDLHVVMSFFHERIFISRRIS